MAPRLERRPLGPGAGVRGTGGTRAAVVRTVPSPLVAAALRGPREPVQSVPVHLGEALRRRMGVTWRLLVKELSAFGVVGAVCFLIDVGLFQVFYAHVGLGAVTSKVLATLVSMTVAYIGHRYWSFSHRARTDVKREYVLFAAINGATLLLSAAVVWFVRYPLDQDGVLVLQAANITAIVGGTVLRYLAYRRWVFPAHAPDAAVADVLARDDDGDDDRDDEQDGGTPGTSTGTTGTGTTRAVPGRAGGPRHAAPLSRSA